MCTVIPPVSATVLLGEKATFSCSGQTLAIVWTMNNISLAVLGIQPTEEKKDNVITSTITVTGSAQDNNASIQCVLIVSLSTNLPLSPVFLTVLGQPQTSCTLSIKILSKCYIFQRIRFLNFVTLFAMGKAALIANTSIHSQKNKLVTKKGAPNLSACFP